VDIFEFVIRLGNYFLDLRRTFDVYRNNAAFRPVQISLEPKKRAFVLDESIGGVLFIEQLYNFGIRVLEVFVKNAVLRIGALRDSNNEIGAILSNVGVK